MLCVLNGKRATTLLVTITLHCRLSVCSDLLPRHGPGKTNNLLSLQMAVTALSVVKSFSQVFSNENSSLSKKNTKTMIGHPRLLWDFHSN